MEIKKHMRNTHYQHEKKKVKPPKELTPCDAPASTPTRRKAILFTYKGCLNIPNARLNIPNAPPPTRRKAQMS